MLTTHMRKVNVGDNYLNQKNKLKPRIMKIRINVEETFTTTITRESMEIDTNNYPELEGMTEDEVSDYIDNNVWDMKPVDNTGLYSSLGEELTDKDTEYDNISGESTEFYVSEVVE